MKNKKYSFKGTISTTQKGVGFVDMPDEFGKKSKKVDRDESIHIDEGHLNTALNGDTVEVLVMDKKVGGKTEKEGEVVKILSRARETYVGTVKFENGKCLVVPDDRKMYANILIPNNDLGASNFKNNSNALNNSNNSNKKSNSGAIDINGNSSTKDQKINFGRGNKGWSNDFPNNGGTPSEGEGSGSSNSRGYPHGVGVSGSDNVKGYPHGVGVSVGNPSVPSHNVANNIVGTLNKPVNFNLKEGDKVFVQILPWTDPKKDLTGKLLTVLGQKGNNDVEMESIVLENGFEVGFSEEVEKEAEELAKAWKTIKPEEIAKRRDIRSTLTFTIDPFDAKDFDDAISFKKLSDEEIKALESKSAPIKGPLYEIGVHIADVSHYVTEGSALDKEAVKRGCSVYLVDRTIPMLPETLSNDLCSLNPGADKLSFSAIFIMDDQARIHSRWFGRTVMNSDHRFTYETAEAVIDGEPTNVMKYSNGLQTPASAETGLKYRDIMVTLNRLAKVLQKEKFSKGAIEFESEEIKFRLDPNGKPVGVDVKQRLDTHKLVEEYMLLANKEVAKYIFDSIKRKGHRDTGAIYRIHDVPDREKIINLSIFVKALGYDLKTKDGEVTAKDFNNLLDQIENTQHESLVRTAAIRSMQKAIYSTKNIGHFGLAFDFYTHFTSPIRRYPDLLVHRVLHKHLHNEPFADRDIVAFQKIAESSTDREIDAADAERSSKKLKQVEYMSTRVGQTFRGRISGITKWGIYVEENETKSEGMIGFRNLGNDYFNFDQKTYSVTGEKTGQKFTLGDEITFKVMAADVDKKTLDYGVL
jgi:ribonuclease R